jgi:hypothetical protein
VLAKETKGSVMSAGFQDSIPERLPMFGDRFPD